MVNATKAVDVSGNTINPVSPYTLIGNGIPTKLKF